MVMPTSWSWLSPLRSRHRGQGTDQRDAAAGHDAFFDRRAGRVQGVLDARLLLLHLDLGRGTDLDDGHAAGQLGHALLQLLAVVVGGGLLDLGADLLDRALMSFFVPAPSMMVVFSLVIDNLLGGAQVVQRRLLQGQADLLGDHGRAGQDGHVLQHRLAAVAEARRLDGRDLDDAADGVDHQGGQGLALDVLGDDQQRLAGLGDALQHRQQVADVGDLLVVQQDVRLFQLDATCSPGC